jgi:phosphate-selective porin OprO and OprP
MIPGYRMRRIEGSVVNFLAGSLTSLLLVCGAAQAQDNTPEYIFPEFWFGVPLYDGERVVARPLLAIVGDYTWFDQDAASLAQVGKQDDTTDLRAFRLGLVLKSKSSFAWDFFFATDFQEQRTREDEVFQLYDFRIGIPLGLVKMYVGKQKEPFVYELVSLSVMASQDERILSPFFVTRSVGVQFTGPLAGDRMTWAAGWFNDWLDSDLEFSDNSNDYVGRITALPFASADNRNYLHLGLGLRRVGDDAGQMRFSGRPESNVADKYIDTGNFTANHASQLSLEAIWSRGPVMLSAEHVDAWVDAPQNGDPHFRGTYLMASWALTGESRVYNRSLGYASGIGPYGRAGAFELVTRYSWVDLEDGNIDGGKLGKWHFGANWWMTRQLKLGVGYGDADLDKGGTLGKTKMFLFRMQWVL